MIYQSYCYWLFSLVVGRMCSYCGRPCWQRGRCHHFLKGSSTVNAQASKSCPRHRINRNLILLLCAIASSPAFSRDLGVIGPTYPIAETDAIALFKSKAADRVASGEHEQWMNDARTESQATAKRPIGTVLPRAIEHRVTEFNPSLTLDADLLDDKGQIIYPAGTTVNPLEIRPLTKTLCFIDGDDPLQVEWISHFCTNDIRNKLILVNGDLEIISKELDKHLYFDQHSFLIEKFGIAALPAAIRQSGAALYVEEFPIK